jgi:outer membrane protein OmpA-like peptidoglycan-associated protein
MGSNERMGLLAGGLALAVTGAGCGHAMGISPQLSGARAVVSEARAGSAAAREPDELLVAMRYLETAENADDGSMAEMHNAYLAERQARVAMADARRMLVEEGAERDQSEYRAELERIARERGVPVDRTATQYAERERMLQQQEESLRQREASLAAEQQARRDAEANSADAMRRLSEMASVRQGETIITLSGEVLFETGSATLRPEARSRLSAVAAVLRSTPDQQAIIAGYTDSRGATARNERLSQERAEAVREYLRGQGVPDDRLEAEGRGEMMPIASNDTAEGRANNRRVEIIIHPTSQTAPNPQPRTAPSTGPQPVPQTAPHTPSTPPRSMTPETNPPPHSAPPRPPSSPSTQPPSTPPPPSTP